MDDLDQFFGNHFSNIAGHQASNVGGTMALHEEEPDQVAKHQAIAKELGIPLRLVEADPEQYRVQLEQKKNTEFLQQAPKTAEWLSKYENQRMARDDMENLTWWERNSKLFQLGQARAIGAAQRVSREASAAFETSALGRLLHRGREGFEALMTDEEGQPNQVGRMVNQLREMVGVDEEVGDLLTPEQRREAILEDVSPMEAAANALVEELEAEGIAPMSLEQIGSFGDAISFVTENLMSSAPHMMASIASGGFSPVITSTLMAGEVNEELVERVPDLSMDKRVAIAGSTGAAMAALELFGLKKVFGRLSPTDVAVEALEGELVKRLTRNGISAATSRIIQAGIAEGTTEVLQEGLIVGVTQLAGGQYTREEVESRLLNAFAAGGAVGGAMRGATETSSATVQLMTDAGRWAMSGGTQADLQLVDYMAEQSQLKSRDPDMFMGMLTEAGLQDATVTLPAAEVFSFYQSAVDDAALDQLGIERADFDAALKTGGDITVPMPNYAANVAGTDLAEVFYQHGKIDPDEMSAAEAEAFEAGIGQEAARAIQQDMERSQAEVQSPEITERLTEQLSASGALTEQEALTTATVAGQIFESLAARTGQDAAAFAERFGLVVRGMSDIPPDGATDLGVSDDPAAPPAPPTPEQVFNQDGIESVMIEVEMDDGTVESVSALEARQALADRQADINQLLRCLRG